MDIFLYSENGHVCDHCRGDAVSSIPDSVEYSLKTVTQFSSSYVLEKEPCSAVYKEFLTVE